MKILLGGKIGEAERKEEKATGCESGRQIMKIAIVYFTILNKTN